MRTKLVKISLIMFIALLLAMITGACSTVEKLTEAEALKVSRPVVFGPAFEKEVYRAQMVIYGNELSGMSVIKRSGPDFRVVFLSEIGLKYFDMEFKPALNEVKVHYVNTILDRKAVIEKITDSFRLIFLMHPEKAREAYFRDAGINSTILEVKRRRRKSYYKFDRNFGTVNTIRSHRRSQVTMVSMSGYDRTYPATLNVNRNNLSMHFEKLESAE